MYFKEFLQQSADEIDLELQSFFIEWSKETEPISPRLKPHVKALKGASAGGKRIRGALVILGYALVSKIPNPELLRIAAAYELFQTAILAHDDIIDESPLRRGQPSLYMQFGGDHNAISQTICLGDIGFFLAFRMIASSNFSEEGKNSAISFFSQVTLNTGVGEMLDVLLSKPGASVAETDVLAVSRYKTAYYTFVGPLLLGAILGGASKIQQAALETYGENLGIAFQLKDDIKDLFGSQASLKKEVGGDIKGGKTTVLIVKARAHANKKQQEILALYGNPSVTRKEIEAIKTVFVQTHALAYTESLAEDYGKRAQAFITTITKDEHMNSMLNDIINFVLKKEHYE